MGDIGSLIVKISADASGLQKAFADLGGSAKQFQAGLGTLAKIGGAAFVAVATAMTAMTVVAGQQAEALQQLSTMTGISTDTLQEYDVLMNRAGLTSEDLVTVMRTLSKNMEDARTGTGNAADRFRQLGIDIRRVTSTDDLIRKVADSLSKMANGTAKAAIEADLLGRGGLRLALAMDGGSKSMDEAARASVTLGAALSSGQLAELANMDDRIDDLTLAWKRFGQQVGSFVAPAIDFASRALANLLSMASQGLKSLNALGSVGGTPDDRKQPPPMIDTTKFAAQQQAMLDAQLKAGQQMIQNDQSMQQALLQNRLATLDVEKAAGIKSEYETAVERQAILGKMSTYTENSLQVQLRHYQKFVEMKKGLFAQDEKGTADRLKFEVDAASKEKDLANQIAVAHVNADTVRMQSGLQVRTFWQKQLQDLVSSNQFSVGLIVNTWTSGIANAIVNGGNFAKAAWQQTQIAIIQGALNTTVQYLAQLAIRSTADKAAAAGTVGVWAGAQASIMGMLATAGGAIKAFFIQSVLPVILGVGKIIVGVLIAIAKAMTGTIFGIPAAIVVLAGAAALVAVLAAAKVVKFASGGIATGPTNAMLGEAGSPEAVIPLNQRGAAFMREAFGMGKQAGQIIHTHVYLNGRQIALAVSDDLPSALRTMGAL